MKWNQPIVRAGRMYQATGADDQAAAADTAKKNEDLAKQQKLHTDLMYANQQLLKVVKLTAAAFIVGAGVVGLVFYLNRPKPQPMAMPAPPMPATAMPPAAPVM